MTRTKGAVQHVAAPEWERLPPLDHPQWRLLLRKWRISHYPTLTLRQLAAALGVSDGRTVRRWEAGEQGIGPGPRERYEALRALHSTEHENLRTHGRPFAPDLP